jgi:hypothetical protein
MNNKTVLNPLLCCPAVASQSCISQFEYLQEWNHHRQQKGILTNLAQQPQKSVPPTPAVAPHSGQAKANLQTLPQRKQLAPVPNKNKYSPEESNWLMSPIKTPENRYQTLDSVSGVHILAADSVYTRIDHEKFKLTPWEEV